MKEIVTKVLDAGGRYGLHPNWKPFKGELAYYLFEPDRLEAKRLEEKYQARAHEVFVSDSALGETAGELEIKFYYNRAMSTSCDRHEDNVTFVGEKKKEVDVVSTERVPMTTIDQFCEVQDENLDFLKLDTEGTELEILKGGLKQVKSHILGIRCEVNFDFVFKGKPIFTAIHDYLLDQDFYLLNLGYNGQGFPRNEFVNVNQPYGTIQDCDAVWLKREKYLFDSNWNQKTSLAVRTLKYAAFCLLNNASDVAIDILMQSCSEHDVDYSTLADTQLYKFMDIQLHKHFYSLKWQPGQSLTRHQEVYSAVFNKPMKAVHEFNQSLELNPD